MIPPWYYRTYYGVASRNYTNVVVLVAQPALRFLLGRNANYFFAAVI
jgi:hypothetical protein